MAETITNALRAMDMTEVDYWAPPLNDPQCIIDLTFC